MLVLPIPSCELGCFSLISIVMCFVTEFELDVFNKIFPTSKNVTCLTIYSRVMLV